MTKECAPDASADWLDRIRWDENGLAPAIAQDAASGRVLMVAWMNREALVETVRTGRGVYWSRSRGRLWRKGEESGNWQRVFEVRTDCDADVILMQIEQKGGAACHTGRESCFFRRLETSSGDDPLAQASDVAAALRWQTTDPVLKDPAQMYGGGH